MRTREPKLIEGIAILKNFEVAKAKMFELGRDVAPYCVFDDDVSSRTLKIGDTQPIHSSRLAFFTCISCLNVHLEYRASSLQTPADW